MVHTAYVEVIYLNIDVATQVITNKPFPCVYAHTCTQKMKLVSKEQLILFCLK